MDYSIVIPAYNEERRIGKSLEKLDEYFSKLKQSYEIIVVDDGSKDNTLKLLKEYKKKIKNLKITSHDTNHGKGQAIESGVLLAEGDRIAFADADLSSSPKEIHKLLKALDEVDVAIASRYISGAKADIPIFRIVLSRIFNYLSRVLFFHNIKDTQCGFKAFRKPVKVVMNGVISHYYVFDLDFLLRARKAGFKIKEIPVEWHYEEGSSLKKSTPLEMFKQIIKLKIYRTFKKERFMN